MSLPPSPTATAHNQTGVTPGTAIALSTLFTYSVSSGDTVLGFDFKETTNNGGYITDNNGNTLTSGVLYGSAGTGIPISELSQYHFVAGPGGTSDSVNFNVEDQFNQISTVVSATVSAATPAPPTATAHNQTGVTPGTAIALSTLFTYSVSSGDTVLGFDFKETTNNGGYITDNNGNTLTSGVLYGSAGTGIPISELSQYHFVAGPGGTSDSVDFNVEDQFNHISTVVSATVSAATPAPPTATAHNQTGVTPGTAIALSTLFTYSVSSGDTVLGFDFKETTNNGGYITDNNGNTLTSGVLYGSAGTGIPISELSQYHFVAGPGGTSDSVDFNVEDQFNHISTVVSATVSAATPAPPTATAHNQTGVTPGTAIALSTLFTYSVSSGDTVLGFDFKETTNNGGYITDNNGNTLTSGVLYGSAGTGIPISELSQYHFVAGPGGTSDSVDFNVEDQFNHISTVVSATVSAAATPAPPTATAHNQTGVTSGTAIALSTLFTYSVSSGDTVLGFDFKETTNNGGYITDNNGNTLTSGVLYGSAGTGIPISELSQYHFVAGPGGTSDSVDFNVEDQFNHISTVVSATVSVQGGGGGGGGGGGKVVAGFDTEFYPGESTMSALRTSTDLVWCGYYLKAPSQNLDTGWLGERAYLQGLGWKIAPLYVGAQDPALGGDNTFVSQTDPTSQGVANAQQALAEMGPNTGATQIVLDKDSLGNWTIQKTVTTGQGFAQGTVVYLDWENAPISQGPNTDYIVAWCNTIAESGTYKPGIYCKQTDISVIAPLVAADNVQFWDATWDSKTPQTVSVTPSQTQFINSVPPGGSLSATSWQYGAGYNTANSLLSNVDLDSSSLYGSSPANDFNGDGNSDLLLHNGQQLALWEVNGTAVQVGSGIVGTLGSGWVAVGTGDFNGDGHSDILLQNGQQLAAWQMNGTTIQPGSGIIGTLGSGWVVAGTADFNGDGNTDILLKNGQQLAVWEMTGTTIQAGSGIIGTLGSGWTVARVGDFSGDGHADILLQNGQQLAVWVMNGTKIQAGSGIVGTLGTGWSVAGVGDFNGDGHADILLKNGQQLAEWLMNGTATQPGSGIVGTLGTGWSVAGVGDYNGDGRSDILLQNGQQLAVWEMNGTSILPGSGIVGTLATGWASSHLI